MSAVEHICLWISLPDDVNSGPMLAVFHNISKHICFLVLVAPNQLNIVNSGFSVDCQKATMCNLCSHVILRTVVRGREFDAHPLHMGRQLTHRGGS